MEHELKALSSTVFSAPHSCHLTTRRLTVQIWLWNASVLHPKPSEGHILVDCRQNSVRMPIWNEGSITIWKCSQQKVQVLEVEQSYSSTVGLVAISLYKLWPCFDPSYLSHWYQESTNICNRGTFCTLDNRKATDIDRSKSALMSCARIAL